MYGDEHSNILKCITAYPLIWYFLENQEQYTIAAGINIYKHLPRLIQSVLGYSDAPNYGVRVDDSAYNLSVQPWVTEDTFKIIESNINFTKPNQKLI